jgi:hypothetical protein
MNNYQTKIIVFTICRLKVTYNTMTDHKIPSLRQGSLSGSYSLYVTFSMAKTGDLVISHRVICYLQSGYSKDKDLCLVVIHYKDPQS